MSVAVSETKVTLKHIKKSFPTKNGTLEVLDDISLDVRENEFLVLFGPGQCGKTVLLPRYFFAPGLDRRLHTL